MTPFVSEAPSAFGDTDKFMAVSQIGGPQYRYQNTIVLIIGTPKNGTPNFGKLPYLHWEFWVIFSDHEAFSLLSMWASRITGSGEAVKK